MSSKSSYRGPRKKTTQPSRWGPHNKGSYYCDHSGYHHTHSHGIHGTDAECDLHHEIPCSIWHQGQLAIHGWFTKYCRTLTARTTHTNPPNYNFNSEYRTLLHKMVFQPLPRNQQELDAAATNLNHPERNLIAAFASLPTPHFPIEDYYTGKRLQDLSADQLHILQTYHAHLTEEACQQPIYFVHLYLMSTAQNNAFHPQATNRHSFLKTARTEEQSKAVHAGGHNFNQLFTSRPDFSLTQAPDGSVIYQTEELIHHRHIDLKGDNFGFHTDTPLSIRDIHKWNSIKKRKVSSFPDLLELLETNHNQTFDSHSITVIWSADQIPSLTQTR